MGKVSNRIYGLALSYLCNISVDIKLFYFYFKILKNKPRPREIK